MTNPGELGHRLIVAHPAPEIRAQLAELLTQWGLDVVGRAPSGLEAMASAGLHRPDLVLASAELEGSLTGASIARALATHYGIPSVVFSGSEGVFDCEPEPRPYEELRSPFGLQELEAVVYGALKRPVGTRSTAPNPSRVAGGGNRNPGAGLASPDPDTVETADRGVWLQRDHNGDGPERPEPRAWSTRAVKAVEEERLRIAQKLHDNLAQRLATHQVHAQLAQTASDERRSKLLEELQTGLRESSELVRTAIRGLRPPPISEMGLPAALRAELRERVAATDVELVLEIDPMPKAAPARIQLCLYRIGQEAVNNALRHADPDTIVVRMAEDGGLIELSVRDDGRGIDPDQPGVIGDHFGILGMRERIGAVGGEFRLESAPGAGTVVRARVPHRG